MPERLARNLTGQVLAMAASSLALLLTRQPPKEAAIGGLPVSRPAGRRSGWRAGA